MQHSLGPHALGMLLINQPLQVAKQMCPAQLALR